MTKIALTKPHGPAGETTILDDLVNVARRRKGVVFVATAATTLMVYLSLFFISETNEATALLQVMLGRQNTELPATVQKGNIYPSGVQRDEIESQTRLLKARESAEAVVDTLGVAAFKFDPPPPETLVQHVRSFIRRTKAWATETVTSGLIAVGLQKELTDREKVIVLLNRSLDAKRDGDSNVIRVTLGLPSRETAVAALTVVIKSFIDRNPYLKAATDVLPALEKQVSKDIAELMVLQQERQRIMTEGSVVSVDQQRTELLQRLHKTLHELDQKKSQLAAVEANLADATTSLFNQSVRDEVVRSNFQIPGLRAGIQQDERSAQAINQRLTEINAAADRLQIVNLNIAAMEKRFLLSVEHRDAAKVAQALDADKILNVAVVSSVGAPPDPVSPNKLRLMAFGIAGGLMIGVILAMLLEWGDEKLRRKEELASISDLPFLDDYGARSATAPSTQRLRKSTVHQTSLSPEGTPGE